MESVIDLKFKVVVLVYYLIRESLGFIYISKVFFCNCKYYWIKEQKVDCQVVSRIIGYQLLVVQVDVMCIDNGVII